MTAQTMPPAAHLVGFDHERRGSSAVRNQLWQAAETEWIATLDDDDLFLPDHLATLAAHSDHADIVYSWCDVQGREWTPNRRFDADALRQGNYIPATVLIRRELLITLGGWPDSACSPNGWEDWALWLNALDADATFQCVPEVTWQYRFHAGNKTWHGETEAF